jgi:CubicO group peptidase (beta-lactamase class C family)
MTKRLFLKIMLLSIILACSKGNEKPDESNTPDRLYFPPPNSAEWAEVTPESLNWEVQQLDALYAFLSENGTRAFIVLKNGKIVIEQYWGNNIANTAPFNRESFWYWASAGKTITAFLTGVAQQEKLLSINDPTNIYLDKWTSMPEEKENRITIRHQLTMTTGLDYTVSDLYCTQPACLKYKVDAGTQWYYHNAPYTLLDAVIAKASGLNFNDFTDQKLELKTGMHGQWINDGYNNIYWSIPRDMARFGLLILAKGKWNETAVMTDTAYFNEMTTSSQLLNPSYGYLWWLNGKSSIVLPGLPYSFHSNFSPNAPDDLISGAGKNGQFVDVISSLNMVVVRMGEAPDGSPVSVPFHDEMWEKIMAVIKPE